MQLSAVQSARHEPHPAPRPSQWDPGGHDGDAGSHGAEHRASVAPGLSVQNRLRQSVSTMQLAKVSPSPAWPGTQMPSPHRFRSVQKKPVGQLVGTSQSHGCVQIQPTIVDAHSRSKVQVSPSVHGWPSGGPVATQWPCSQVCPVGQWAAMLHSKGGPARQRSTKSTHWRSGTSPTVSTHSSPAQSALESQYMPQ